MPLPNGTKETSSEPPSARATSPRGQESSAGCLQELIRLAHLHTVSYRHTEEKDLDRIEIYPGFTGRKSQAENCTEISLRVLGN